MIEAAAAVLPLAMTLPASVASRAPSARDLARRASEYVRAYDQRVVAIVGEERYEQRSRERAGGRAPHDVSQSARSRLAWVHLPRLDDTVAVREVFEIDGHAVQHSSRLEQLLKAPAAQHQLPNLSAGVSPDTEPGPEPVAERRTRGYTHRDLIRRAPPSDNRALRGRPQPAGGRRGYILGVPAIRDGRTAARSVAGWLGGWVCWVAGCGE